MNIIDEKPKIIHMRFWLFRFEYPNPFEVQILDSFPIPCHKELLRIQIVIRKVSVSIFIKTRKQFFALF